MKAIYPASSIIQKRLENLINLTNGCLEFFQMTQSAHKAAVCKSLSASRGRCCDLDSFIQAGWCQLNQSGGDPQHKEDRLSWNAHVCVRAEERAMEKNRRVTVRVWRVHCVCAVTHPCTRAVTQGDKKKKKKEAKMWESMQLSGIYNHGGINIFHMHLFLNQGKWCFPSHWQMNDT